MKRRAFLAKTIAAIPALSATKALVPKPEPAWIPNPNWVDAEYDVVFAALPSYYTQMVATVNNHTAWKRLPIQTLRLKSKQ